MDFYYSWSDLTKFHGGAPVTLETIPPCFRYDDFTNWFPSRTRLKTLKLNNLRLQQPQVVTSLNYKWQDASLTLSKIKRNGWLVKTSIIFFLKTKWGIISFADWKKAKKLLKYISFFSNLCSLLKMSELAFEITCQKLIERFHIYSLPIFDYFINFIREGNLTHD